MSNRAQRRAAGKIGTGRVTKHEAIPRRPVGEHGVEVDTANGLVHMALHAGEVCVTIAWKPTDAQVIVGLLQDAIDRMGTPAEDITVERSSGLVVARTLPTP